MKRTVSILLAFVISLIITFFCGCSVKSDSELEEYCHSVNELICNIDFSYAKTEGKTIILYSDKNQIIDEIITECDNIDAEQQIKYIQKEGNIVYFIQSVAIDDEFGIMFINDETNNVLNGIKKPKESAEIHINIHQDTKKSRAANQNCAVYLYNSEPIFATCYNEINLFAKRQLCITQYT